MSGSQLKFAERIELEKNDYVMIYRATDLYGQDFFCYIRCGLEGYSKMQNDWMNKTQALPSSYGEVIYRAFLKDPDAKAQAFLDNWYAENS